MLVLSPAEFGSRRPRSKIPAVIFLIILVLFGFWAAFWWYGRDTFIGQLPAVPVAYLHLKLDANNRSIVHDLVAKSAGMEVPADSDQLALAAFSDGNKPVWYLVTDRPVGEGSQQSGKIFLTAIGAFSNQFPSPANPKRFKKPWIWFGRPDYGFVDSTVLEDYLPSLASAPAAAYVQANFRSDRLSFSFLPANWNLGQVLFGGTFGRPTSLIDFNAVNSSSSTQEAYFGTIPGNFFDLFKLSPDQTTALDFLSKNTGWLNLKKNLDSAQLLLQFNGGQWQAEIYPANPINFDQFDSPSRSFLAEMWPSIVSGRLADGSAFQEKKADIEFYQWQPLANAGQYKLNHPVAGNDVFLTFQGRGILLSNYGSASVGQNEPKGTDSNINWLSLIKDCAGSAPDSLRSAVYSQTASLNGYQNSVFVDNGANVDICFYKNVDK